MAKGSGTTRKSSPRASRGVQSASRQDEATKLYDFWVRGGSNSINAQIDPSFTNGYGAYDGVKRDLDLLDTVFEPAKSDIRLYKGLPEDMTDYLMKQTGAKSASDLVGKTYVDKFYSSTSDNMRAAEDYAYRNADFDDQSSIVHFNIKKGTPIKRAVGYTDQETTLRRNLRYKITRVRTEEADDGQILHHFYITVSDK